MTPVDRPRRVARAPAAVPRRGGGRWSVLQGPAAGSPGWEETIPAARSQAGAPAAGSREEAAAEPVRACRQGGAGAGAGYSSSCSILDSTQSKRPLVTAARQYLHSPTWLMSSGAPQLGHTLSSTLRLVVCAPRERWKVQNSVKELGSREPKIILPVRSSTS